MNFLQLVKRLARETGTELEANITSVETPPAAGYGETTENRTRLISWIREAWIEVQEDQEQWDFMVRRATMPLARGQASYDVKELFDDACDDGAVMDYIVPFVAPLDRRYVWMVDTRPDPFNKNICYYIPHEFFFGDRDRYNDRTQGIPSRWSIKRNDCIEFDVQPDTDDYHIEFAYKRYPQELMANEDELWGLEKKTKHHMVVVYKAMIYAALFDESDKQVQRATKLYRDRMNKLRINELGEYSMTGTRA